VLCKHQSRSSPASGCGQCTNVLAVSVRFQYIELAKASFSVVSRPQSTLQMRYVEHVLNFGGHKKSFSRGGTIFVFLGSSLARAKKHFSYNWRYP
jgi:superfamily II DNA helicase RecQ